MTDLQSLLSALVRHTKIPQVQIAEKARLSQKHLSQMLNGRIEGTLTAWQAVLDAAGVSVRAGVPDLREALEARLGSLPVMLHENRYPVEALPKAELLDLLAAHPAAPAVPQPAGRYRLAWLSARRRASYASKAFLAEACAAREMEAAVPQPVDREALIRAIVSVSEPDGSDRILGREYVENYADVFADAVLAVLAGSEVKP